MSPNSRDAWDFETRTLIAIGMRYFPDLTVFGMDASPGGVFGTERRALLSRQACREFRQACDWLSQLTRAKPTARGIPSNALREQMEFCTDKPVRTGVFICAAVFMQLDLSMSPGSSEVTVSVSRRQVADLMRIADARRSAARHLEFRRHEQMGITA